jgi:putative oxidoreductase
MKSNLDSALLLIRIGLAAVFIAHGWDKISNMEGTIAFFASINLPAFLAYFVAYVEFLGGISMLLGIFTGFTGIILAINMLVAIGLVKVSKGFLGGYEFDLMLFLAAIAISLTGPGVYTIKRLLKRG